MSLPLAVRMVLLAGGLSAPVLPPFLTTEDVVSFYPSVHQSLGQTQIGAPTSALSRVEEGRRAAFASCPDQEGESRECITSR